jgi:N,N'-diacetyllegionaminate synthase
MQDEFPRRKRHMEIIAEIGLHHGGSAHRAEEIIASARACGCDAVKLQFFTAKDLAGRPKGAGWDVLQRYYLRPRQIQTIAAFADYLDLEFGCSFFGVDGVREFAKYAGCLDFAKVPAPQSDEVARAISGYGLPVMRSVYPERDIMSGWVDDCKGEVTFLHCTPKYPTPDEELNLNCIHSLPKDAPCGWSCHAEARHPMTAELACLSYAAGSRVFEFHFRDDAVLPGSPDYDVSVWPDLMAYTIQQLKKCAKIMGGFTPSARTASEIVHDRLFAGKPAKEAILDAARKQENLEDDLSFIEERIPGDES